MTLFDRVSELSKKQGISIFDLSNKLGLSRNAVYSWKTSSPKADTLDKVADYFNVSTDYLLGRTNDPTLKEKSADMTPKGRAIGRGFDQLDEDKQDLFERLLRQMQEDDDDDD